MIFGFCQNGKASEALGVLDEMRFEGMKMDCVTILTILPACAQMDDILHGMLIHLYIIKHGLEFDVFVSNALINISADITIGSISKHDLRRFLRWAAIHLGYASLAEIEAAPRTPELEPIRSNYSQVLN
ncbi:Glutamine-dependent NAD(+) synthetase [Camellia lanceoleosa]|uniref:Glutamine-dependent NAD(+) synthetase n=1 Tax=Camellia lanceoleosa TaxID=1840588 RepID=A0ACC0IZA9_9ERIC|nr:Glutamine-dependent NAD(+) synthetase [Camellia lanceoleosa]